MQQNWIESRYARSRDRSLRRHNEHVLRDARKSLLLRDIFTGAALGIAITVILSVTYFVLA